MMSDVEAIADLIGKNDYFYILGHIYPDGDCIGSMLGLYHALNAVKKNAVMVCMEGLTDKYSFLPGFDLIQKKYDPGRKSVAFILDLGDPDRLGEKYQEILSDFDYLVNIDHHLDNKKFANYSIYSTNASSAGELVYALIVKMGIELTEEMATSLYTAIVTDTGSFAYNNTTPSTLNICAELVGAGVNSERVHEHCFRMKTRGEILLLKYALNSLSYYFDSRVAVMKLTKENFDSCGKEIGDTEGIVNTARYIDGVCVGILLKETDYGKIRVSLRSVPELAINEVAGTFGGGGHRQASGCTIYGCLEYAEQKIIEVIDDFLKRNGFN